MTVICILGMHRSGTSCLAGSLQAAGLFTGEVQEWNTDNLKGQRENLKIMELNNSILKDNDGAWDRVPKSFIFTPEHRSCRDEIIANLERQSPIWMFKDPRTVLMLEFWREGIPDCQFVGSFRHPLNVAMSLYQRNKMPISEGIQLWLEHNRCLLAAWNQEPFPLICFDLDREEYLSKIEEIVHLLQTRFGDRVHLSIAAAKEFYESGLVHEKEISVTSSLENQEEIKNGLVTAEKLYNELRKAAGLSNSLETPTSSGYLIPLEETIEACQQILEIQPDNPKVHFMLGNIHRENGEIEAAIASYQTALNLQPENFNYYQNLGNLYQDNDLADLAVELSKTALQFLPNHPELYCLLGQSQHKNGEIEAAIASYQTALDIVPKYLAAYAQLGHLFFQQGQLDRAMDCYQTVLDIQPRSPYLCVQVGNILRKQGNWDEAMTYYDRAIIFDSKNFGAYKNRGDAFKEREKFEEALSAYHQAKDLQPENPWIYITLGNLYRQIDRIEEAIPCYQKVIELDDRNFSAYKNLGDIQNQKGKIEEAIDCYQKALEIQPNRPGIHQILGNTSWKKNDRIQAIEHYQKAIELNPQQPFSLYKRLGDYLRQQGKTKEAISAYKSALAIQPENSQLHHLIEKLTNKIQS